MTRVGLRALISWAAGLIRPIIAPNADLEFSSPGVMEGAAAALALGGGGYALVESFAKNLVPTELDASALMTLALPPEAQLYRQP